MPFSTNIKSLGFPTIDGNSINAFEQSAGGFDPSIGRTPVEQSNNYDTAALAITTNRVVKASPGYLHKIILAAGKAYQFEIHDNATTNSGLVFASGAITSSAVPIVIELNTLMTAGITIRNTHGSVAHVAGDVLVLYR
jgi:hypothetical protein